MKASQRFKEDNQLSRPGENPRGPDGCFTLATFNQSEMTTVAEQPIKESALILEESMLETTLQSPTEISPVYGQGKRKLIMGRGVQTSPRQINVQMYLEMVNEQGEIQQNTTPTTEDDPTVTDKIGNTVNKWDKQKDQWNN